MHYIQLCFVSIVRCLLPGQIRTNKLAYKIDLMQFVSIHHVNNLKSRNYISLSDQASFFSILSEIECAMSVY